MTQERRKALVTGAVGGMGRACARLFGVSHDLVLTDVAAPALERFASDLAEEGYCVARARAGPIGDAALLAQLADDLVGEAPFVLVHTAALSPSQGDWRAIMDVGLVATVRLLDSVESVLRPGSVAVLIASLAGHMIVPDPAANALTADPLAPDFLDRIGALIAAREGPPETPSGCAYSLAKQAVIRLAERRALAWGPRGGRVVSISPGVIATPMGRLEMASHPSAAHLTDAAPAGRPGTAAEVAHAARFLASDEAAFITGCDLQVDGGAVALVRQAPG